MIPVILNLSYIEVCTKYNFLETEDFWRRKAAYELNRQNDEIFSEEFKIFRGSGRQKYVRILAYHGVLILLDRSSSNLGGSEVIMCPLEMTKIGLNSYMKDKSQENRAKLYQCLDLFADLVNSQEIVDITGFNYLFKNVMVDELIYLLSRLKSSPEFELNKSVWLFKGKNIEFNKLYAKLNMDEVETMYHEEIEYKAIMSGEIDSVHINTLCLAYNNGFKHLLNIILERLIQNNYDKIFYYSLINEEENLLEAFSSFSENIDGYCCIFTNQKDFDNLELVLKLYSKIKGKNEQQQFIRHALQIMDNKTKIFRWALELFDPNYIKEKLDINLFIFKSYEDIQGLYKIKDKIDKLSSLDSKYILNRLLMKCKTSGLYAGYKPLLRELFEY